MAIGKIRRLPREIREQLNQRLDNGEPGKRLVGWLNGLPAVRALLAAKFGGAAINEQNLTNWRQGGFREWLMEQEIQPLIRSAAGAAVPPAATLEHLTTVVTARYLVAVREWQRSPVAGRRQWRQMRVLLHDVMKLREREQTEQRLALAWKRLAWQQKTQARQAMAGMLREMEAWPEVKAGFQEAFENYERRKSGIESGSIKVNQGREEIKNHDGQRAVAEGLVQPPAAEVELGQIKVDQSSQKIKFINGLAEPGAYGGQREVYFANGAALDGDRSLRVRKRCRRYGSATAVQNGRRFDYIMGLYAWDLEVRTPQSACYAGRQGRSASPVHLAQNIDRRGREASNDRKFIFAGGEQRDEDWSWCARKRCRRYRSATAVQNGGGRDHVAVRMRGVRACQYHKVPAAQADRVAARALSTWHGTSVVVGVKWAGGLPEIVTLVSGGQRLASLPVGQNPYH